ncbi:hypothetical protein SK128_006575, partial [Halocaridina rubra]
ASPMEKGTGKPYTSQIKGQWFCCGGPHMIRYCKAQKVRCFRYVAQCEGDVYTDAFDGSHNRNRGASYLKLGVSGKYLTVRAVVSDNLVDGVDGVLGMDVINQLDGVNVNCGRIRPSQGSPRWQNRLQMAAKPYRSNK